MLTVNAHLHDHSALEARLVTLAGSTGWLMDSLHVARDVMFAPWCIAVGAVRSIVWNSLHGSPLLPPEEVDLVYYDTASPNDVDADIAAELARRMPPFRWDVVNQAHAHRFTKQGQASPFCSLEHAISAWPETATAVGLSLDDQGSLRVVAPLGLADLFDLVLRPSPFLRDPTAFAKRLEEKAFTKRWPRLRVELAPKSVPQEPWS